MEGSRVEWMGSDLKEEGMDAKREGRRRQGQPFVRFAPSFASFEVRTFTSKRR